MDILNLDSEFHAGQNKISLFSTVARIRINPPKIITNNLFIKEAILSTTGRE